MPVSMATLRRVERLEQSRPVMQPVGLWPAIIRNYDEWSELAEASQLQLAQETRGTYFQDEEPAPVEEDMVIEPAPAVAPAPDPIQDYLRSQHAAAQQRAVEAEQQSPQELTQWAIDYLNQHDEQ